MAVHNSVLSSFERLQPRFSPLARRRQFPRWGRLESLQFITTTGRLISWGNGAGLRHLSLVSIYAIILYTFPLASVSLLLWIPFPCSLLLHLQHRLLFEDIFNLSLMIFYMISDFLREAAENCTLLSCYAASDGNIVPTFRDKLSVESRTLGMASIGCPKTSVINQHNSLRNNPEERSSVMPCHKFPS